MAYAALVRSLNGLNSVIWKHKIISTNTRTVSQFPRVVGKNPNYIPSCKSVASFATVGKSDGPEGTTKKKKGPKITLLGVDGNLSVVSLEEAQKLAKRRDLKLVKITDVDTKTDRPIYKLMTGAQFFEEDLKERKLKAEKRKTEIKREKLLTLSTKISEHDLQSRVKNMKKWLEKNCEAHIVITQDGSSEEAAEDIYKVIQTGLKDYGQVFQKQKKGNSLKFKVHPLKKKEVEEEPKELTQET
ncbi:translation initiation factor IF-3 [Anabrus simplex]|uniref:translation initiation factor IF-3 n=1 Tax=Anabrus simplex TaxID=316456 RepID=UPI0035A2EC31